MGNASRGTRRRRWSSRACAVAGALCLVFALIGTTAGAQEEETPRPDVFRSSASAFVAQAFLDRDALIPVPEAFRFIAIDTTGTYESSNQTARASLFYPGNGVISGPNLACGTFGSQFPEQFAPIIDACLGFEYPLTVRADSLEPDGATSGAVALGDRNDPISGRAVRAVAHAADDSSTADAAMTGLRVLGLPGLGEVQVPLPVPGAPELDPTILTVESATGRTDQRIDESGVLLVDAESVLEGVRLIGGLVSIDSIRSTVRLTDDGRGETTREAALDLGGVTVGGVPARITEDGLVVGSPAGGPLGDQLSQLVNQLVQALNIEVTLLDAEDGVDEAGVAFARVGGLLVEFEVDVRGLPILPGPIGDLDPNGLYQGTIQLGQAGATATSTFVEVPVFTPGGPAPIGNGSAGPLPSGGTSGIPSVDSTPATPPDVPPQSAAPSTPGSAQQEQIVLSLADDLYAGRIRLVYLAFTLIALAACLAPRFALPARLPGSNS